MKRLAIILLVICAFTISAGAQTWKTKRFETSIGIGTTQFFSDIGGYTTGENFGGLRDLSFFQTRFSTFLALKYRLSSTWNLRGNLAFGFLNGKDEKGKYKDRGYEVTSTVFETGLMAEYYFLRNEAENNYFFAKSGEGFFKKLFSSLDLYGFTGVGAIDYSVKPNYKLLTEDIVSGGKATVIPAGIGASLVFSPDFNFGLEIGGRYAFTDYIDGFTNSASKANDMYYFVNFTLTYKLNTGSNGLPSFR